jgi:hypothetical protein
VSALERGFRQNVREYVAGAFLAFGIVFLASELFVLGFTWAGAEVKSIGGDLPGLFICLHLVGGALGGYLVSRRRRKDIIRAGAITSLFAYIFEFIYNLLFVGTFENILHAILGFFFGGVLGAMYVSYQMVRMTIPSKRQEG